MRPIVAVAIALVSLFSGPPFGASHEADSPHTGRSSRLQGTYDIASMTPLERAQGTPLVMTREEAALREGARGPREALALPSNGDRGAPPVGGDGSSGAAGNVGGYNNFWIDNGLPRKSRARSFSDLTAGQH